MITDKINCLISSTFECVRNGNSQIMFTIPWEKLWTFFLCWVDLKFQCHLKWIYTLSSNDNDNPCSKLKVITESDNKHRYIWCEKWDNIFVKLWYLTIKLSTPLKVHLNRPLAKSAMTILYQHRNQILNRMRKILR